jgi:electron transfer flavoprotein beta subunit
MLNIVVCVKQVPDTTEVRLHPETGTLIREGVPSIMNPDDKAGLEAALSIKDKQEANVTVITMGPPQAEAILREALAMGADEVILVTDRAFGGSDTLATSTILATAIKAMPYDLIITGRQAIDGDTAQVGPQIAEHLGLVNISYAQSIEVVDDNVVVLRQYEDRYHLIEAKLPCLITTLSELNKPRYMTPGGIFEAYRSKSVGQLSNENLQVEVSKIGLKGSPTRVAKSFTKELKGKGTVVDLGVQESVDFIITSLQSKFII